MKRFFDNLKYDLPDAYLQFLEKHPKGTELSFSEYDDGGDGKSWDIMGAEELKKSFEMKDVGIASNYNAVSLYVKCYAEMTGADKVSSPDGLLSAERVSDGFVFGSENGDYLYMDPADGFSVWIYFHDGGDVKKVGSSFEDWLKKTT